MTHSFRHAALAALIALAPLTAAAAPAEVGTPALAWQSVGTLSPAAGYAENIGVAGLVQGTFGDCIIVGGGANVAYTDGYAYDPKTRAWTEIKGPNVDGTPVSLLGARSVRLNADEMLVVGGFNREIYNWAVSNLSTLQGEEKDAFRAHYFTMPPEDYHWNREILVYSAKADAWRSVGQLPFPAPCGEALVIARGALFSISGEVKPGVRSPRLYRGLFVK